MRRFYAVRKDPGKRETLKTGEKTRRDDYIAKSLGRLQGTVQS